MPTAEFLRLKARQCRDLLSIATVPEVRAQLEVWARDFDDQADKVEITRRPVLILHQFRCAIAASRIQVVVPEGKWLQHMAVGINHLVGAGAS